VGFAALSNTAIAMNGVNAPAPSPTIGSVSASATAGTGGGSNAASHRWGVSWASFVGGFVVAVGAAWM
jgi:cathepsin D